MDSFRISEESQSPSTRLRYPLFFATFMLLAFSAYDRWQNGHWTNR
jgi:hypothetical protein